MFDAVVIDEEGTIFVLDSFDNIEDAEACMKNEELAQSDNSFKFEVLEW